MAQSKSPNKPTQARAAKGAAAPGNTAVAQEDAAIAMVDTDPQGTAERAGVQSVEVGFSLLHALEQAGGPLALKDLAARAQMSPAKAHRYLVSFQRLQLVVQDARDSHYDLGPGALRLGLSCLARVDAVALARQRLPALAAQLQAQLAIAVWGNRGPTIVHWECAPHLLAPPLRLGDVLPLLTSATGLCFAAYAPPEAVTPLLADELALARRQQRRDVPTTPEGLGILLGEARRLGIASARGTLLPGHVGLSAPVFDASGHLALVVTAMGPQTVIDGDANGPAARRLRQLAQTMSADLGYQSR